MTFQNHDGDTFTSSQHTGPLVEGGQGRQVDTLTGCNCLLATIAAICLIGFMLIALILLGGGAHGHG
jgi:hypothetical protein